MKTWLISFAGAALVGCSSGSGGPSPVDSGADGTHHDATGMPDAQDGSADGGSSDATDAFVSDAPIPTTALVRLANWSPDAPGLDFCVSPHAARAWTGPVLAGALGAIIVGRVSVTDAAVVIDSSTPHLRDSGNASSAADASDAAAEAASDAGGLAEAGPAIDSSRAPEAGDARADAPVAPTTGVPFPRVSPYVALSPGDYDLRIVGAGALDCAAPVAPEVDDAPALRAGAVVTLAAVGDTVAEGNDPPLAAAVFEDDTAVSSAAIALRFVNAVPSVAGVTFASGLVVTGNAVPYLSAAQFGAAGVDTDAGPVDPDDYLGIPPIHDAIWSLINANGGVSTLVSVENASIPAGSIATVVGIGGESGPSEGSVGIMVCIDLPPIAAGETAACNVIQGATGGVCPGCP